MKNVMALQTLVQAVQWLVPGMAPSACGAKVFFDQLSRSTRQREIIGCRSSAFLVALDALASALSARLAFAEEPYVLRALFDQAAKRHASARSSAGVHPEFPYLAVKSVQVVWNKRKEMDQVHQGVYDETCGEWVTFLDAQKCNTTQTS